MNIVFTNILLKLLTSDNLFLNKKLTCKVILEDVFV